MIDVVKRLHIEAALEAFDNLSPADRAKMKEEQRRSFVFGNCSIENPSVTRAMVDDVADKMEKTDE